MRKVVHCYSWGFVVGVSFLTKIFIYISGEFTVKRDQLFQQLSAIRVKKDAIFEKKKALLEKLKTTSEAAKNKRESTNQIRAGLKYKSAAEVDEAISKLEYELATQHFKLIEEKKIVAEISALKKSKKTLSEFDAAKASLEDEKEKTSKLRDEVNNYTKEIAAFRDEENELKKELDKLKQLQDKEYSKFKVHFSKRETLRKEIDALFSQKREISEKFKKEKQEYFLATKEEREKARLKREEIQKQRIAEITAIKEARRKEQEELEALTDPWEDHKHQCENLKLYFEKFITVEREAETLETAPKPPACGEKENIDGKSVLVFKKKSERDEENFFVGNAGKAKKKTTKKAAKNITLNLPLGIHQACQLVELEPPKTSDEIPACLEKLALRKKFYQNAPRPVKKGRKKPEAADEEDETLAEAAIDPIDKEILDQSQGA
eukprot:Sdes_comp18000_c0_seq1m7266